MELNWARLRRRLLAAVVTVIMTEIAEALVQR